MTSSVPGQEFDEPRLAAIYDALDADRSDLLAYLAIAEELGARSVLDLGSGTGVFALMLAERGIEAIGVEPAKAMLDVARAKPGADRVRWIHGDASAIPPDGAVDLVTMTANVAQVFLTNDDWLATLRAVHAALRPGGNLVFETRDPERRAWEEWTEERTRSTTDVPGVGPVTDWVQVTDVSGDLVTFASPNVFPDGTVITARSTLRFRSRAEVEASLGAAHFTVLEVRDAPDRPGRELVFLAARD
ncbi:MAG TPA: class I SAM-dependent methyltransferase [Candidatus Limnocylindria bacterium]|nr:class I SAM-dependent methyltransferase [Candidatus Limnocylindria bacterium]